MPIQEHLSSYFSPKEKFLFMTMPPSSICPLADVNPFYVTFMSIPLPFFL